MNNTTQTNDITDIRESGGTAESKEKDGVTENKEPKDIKAVIAANISTLRIAYGMTQVALADKLCYSDKAVSKWERGDSIPDISVLKQIADLFSVTVDYLINEHSVDEKLPMKEQNRQTANKNGLFITAIALCGIWFAAILTFVLVWVVSGKILSEIFVCVLPVCSLTYLVLNSIWQVPGKRKLGNYIALSLFFWSVLLVLYCFTNAWMFFLLGIPVQIILTLAFLIKPQKKRHTPTL